MIYVAMGVEAGDIEDDDNDLPLGIIVGASVGGVLVIAVLVIIGLLLKCCMHR